MLIAEPPEGWRGESDLIVAVVMKPIGSYPLYFVSAPQDFFNCFFSGDALQIEAQDGDPPALEIRGGARGSTSLYTAQISPQAPPVLVRSTAVGSKEP
jgi:hypothetical protein